MESTNPAVLPYPPGEPRPAPTAAAPGRPLPTRLVSLDTYRGAVMLLLASGGFGIGSLARNFPTNATIQFLHNQNEHTGWRGCTLWDLIQPSFMFMVGVAIPFSLASRIARGQSRINIWAHTFWRALILILLGIFLRSINQRTTNYTFVDVVTQIGLGYPFLILIAWMKPKFQMIAAAVILIGYWALFAAYPISPEVAARLPKEIHGFAAHWNLFSNPGVVFDRWFLNLFPQRGHFDRNGGGYSTLNFIPSLATMTFGLLAGELMRSRKSAAVKFSTLLIAAAVGLSVGWLLDQTDICPLVKRIWTPSWALFAGGWTCLLLAIFFALVDWLGLKRWALPFVVVGMNSIAVYLMTEIEPFNEFVNNALHTHLPKSAFSFSGGHYSGVVESCAFLLIVWLICFWMFRRKIFLRV